MTKKQRDRRVQRTKQALYEALVSLILEKRYDKITVQNIVDRANVGRSTFYAHFLDKEDLLQKGFAMFSEQTEPDKETVLSSEANGLFDDLFFFQHFCHAHLQRHLHEAMLMGGGNEVLLTTVRRYLQEDIETHLSRQFPADKSPIIPLPMIAHFLAGALLFVSEWWLDKERPYSPEEMNDMFHQLALGGVEKLLRDV